VCICHAELKGYLLTYYQKGYNNFRLRFKQYRYSGIGRYSWVQDWIVQCFTSPPTQYRLYGRQFLQVKRPNQQYQSTEGRAQEHNG